jgi:hypothetical protein
MIQPDCVFMREAQSNGWEASDGFKVVAKIIVKTMATCIDDELPSVLEGVNQRLMNLAQNVVESTMGPAKKRSVVHMHPAGLDHAPLLPGARHQGGPVVLFSPGLPCVDPMGHGMDSRKKGV